MGIDVRVEVVVEKHKRKIDFIKHNFTGAVAHLYADPLELLNRAGTCQMCGSQHDGIPDTSQVDLRTWTAKTFDDIDAMLEVTTARRPLITLIEMRPGVRKSRRRGDNANLLSHCVLGLQELYGPGAIKVVDLQHSVWGECPSRGRHIPSSLLLLIYTYIHLK